MRGSLHEMEVKQARAGQIEAHKRKLIARKSLGKGGSLLASEALQKIKDKRRKEADEVLRKANTAVTRAENKQKEELRIQGVQARKDEKERRQYIQQHQALGTSIPDYMWIPIRDPQKEPTPTETEARRAANQSLYEAVEHAQKDRDRAYSENITEFTSIPIDPAILEEERQFQIHQRGGLQVVIPVDSEEEVGGVESGVGSGVEDYQSVASIDSIAENADFISLE
jgi:hypothetical protein